MRTTFYVGNVSYEASELDLQSFFEFGGFEVSRVKIITDRETGKSRGFGFVDVKGDGSRVIDKLGDQELAGRAVKIRQAEARQQRHADRDLL